MLYYRNSPDKQYYQYGNGMPVFENQSKSSFKFPENPQISGEIKSFLRQMLESDPDKRMSWDQLFNHPLIVNNYEKDNIFKYWQKFSDFVYEVKNEEYKELESPEIKIQKANDKIEGFENQYAKLRFIIDTIRYLYSDKNNTFLKPKFSKRKSFFITLVLFEFYYHETNCLQNQIKRYLNKLTFDDNLEQIKLRAKNLGKKIQADIQNYLQEEQRGKLINNCKNHNSEISSNLEDIKYLESIYDYKYGEKEMIQEVLKRGGQQIVPIFFEELKQIMFTLEMKSQLSQQQKDILSFLYCFIMITRQRLRFTFSTSCQQEIKDIHRYIQMDYMQKTIFARVVQGLGLIYDFTEYSPQIQQEEQKQSQ